MENKKIIYLECNYDEIAEYIKKSKRKRKTPKGKIKKAFKNFYSKQRFQKFHYIYLYRKLNNYDRHIKQN